MLKKSFDEGLKRLNLKFEKHRDKCLKPRKIGGRNLNLKKFLITNYLTINSIYHKIVKIRKLMWLLS